jgi:3-hydroxybutyryl-CoA dehydratase
MAENERSLLDRLGIDIGDTSTHRKTITEKDITQFAEVSGDYNPVHLDEEFARKTLFGGRIAHGVIAISLISAAVAKFPGLVILVSHSSRFLRPVRIGDTITATAEVIDTRQDKGIVRLKTTCANQDGKLVVEGETEVRVYEAPD